MIKRFFNVFWHLKLSLPHSLPSKSPLIFQSGNSRPWNNLQTAWKWYGILGTDKVKEEEEGLPFLLRQDLLEFLDEAQLIVWNHSLCEIFTLIAGVPLVLDVHNILPALEDHGIGIT